VDVLRRFVNVRSEEDWKLLVAWLIQAFRPTGPYPILILQGEQGSAKTTTARILRAITDPSSTPVRTVPRGEHDLMIAANNSWVVTIDNLSGLQPWLSDALCRLSTGGGFGTRTLYENDEETLFDAMRPIILNGITDIATRPDLLDRAIILTLPASPKRTANPNLKFGQSLSGPCLTYSGVSSTLLAVRSSSFRTPSCPPYPEWLTSHCGLRPPSAASDGIGTRSWRPIPAAAKTSTSSHSSQTLWPWQ
jgi:hypothetical protein